MHDRELAGNYRRSSLHPLVDIVDLDGAALLADDPFVGAHIDGGQVTLPTGPGLGVRRR